jgi:hypothetical protein
VESSDEGSSASSESTESTESTGSSSSGEVACAQAHPFPISRGRPVAVDGSVDPGEWDDAQPYAVTPAPGWTVPVGIKHDGEALLVVFAQIQPPARPPFAAFPELMIDVGNDKSSVLADDDWWFHVSATDCHGMGEYDNYRTCVPEGEGWDANNFPGGSLIDLVEIRIEFATLGVDPNLEQDIGLLLRLSDTQGYAAHWPADGNADAPATWATVHLCPG